MLRCCWLQALAFREEQEKALNADAGCKHGDMRKKKLGDVTTVNITALQSGVSTDGGKTHALNVIPTQAIAGFDVRISPHLDLGEFKTMLDKWCSAEGVTWEFTSWTNPLHEHYTTKLDDDNVWWQLFKNSCEVSQPRWFSIRRLGTCACSSVVSLSLCYSRLQKVGVPVETEVFPAATDSRFMRKVGIPALGFSPMNNTEILLHEHNESLQKDTFVRGVDVYVTIFQDMFSHV